MLTYHILHKHNHIGTHNTNLYPSGMTGNAEKDTPLSLAKRQHIKASTRFNGVYVAQVARTEPDRNLFIKVDVDFHGLLIK